MDEGQYKNKRLEGLHKNLGVKRQRQQQKANSKGILTKIETERNVIGIILKGLLIL